MKTLGIIFSNFNNNSLKELTEHRAVAALPFGSKYRHIDFALSNLSNSGIKNIGIITKNNYSSLMEHLSNPYFFDLNSKNEGLHFIPPFFFNSSLIYRGKMEALYSALSFLEKGSYENVVILDSNIILNINYKKIIERHIKLNADITAIAVPLNKQNNITNAAGENVYFNVNDNKKINKVIIANKPPQNDLFLGLNMYIIKRSVLIDFVLAAYQQNELSFERFVLQSGIKSKKISAYLYKFNGIFLKNDSIQSYFNNNLKLLNSDVRKGLFIKERPILTNILDEPPTSFDSNANIENCLISNGCKIYGTVKNSILFNAVTVCKNAHIENSVIMQNCVIEPGAEVYYAILDKNVLIKSNSKLTGAKTHAITVSKGEIV